MTNETFDVVFPADAKIPTVKLTPVENMLGRWVKIPVNLTAEEILSPNGTQDLLADLYWELYKTYPQERENIPEVRKVNKAILDMVKESNDWKALRTQTSASILMSKLCASGMIVNLLKDETIQEALKKQEQAQEMEKQAQQEGTGGQSHQKKQQSQQLIDDALKSLGQDPKQGNGGEQKQSAVSKAVKDTKDDASEAKAMCKSWGMEDGSDENIDAREVNRMMEYYKKHGRIQQVTSYMGRVKGVSMATREHHSKVKGVTISRDGYTQNLQRMFPAEMALLRKDVNPMVRAQKASEYCDRGLLGMIEESKAVKQGPLVIAVDESGSMSGEGILKAKGLALGICLSALENGQPFNVFGFSNRAFTGVSSDDPKSRLMDWSLKFNGGGTDFDSAIRQALDIIEESEHKYASDFVLITDGECNVNSSTIERFQEFAEKYGTRMITFGIDTQDSYSEVFEVSDAHIDVDSLDDLGKISEILTEKLIESGRQK